MFDHMSLSSSLNEKCFRQTLYRKSKHTFHVQYFFPQNLAVYEIFWKNMVQPGKSQMSIWRMRIECCITQATNTHSEYVILTAFLLQQWLFECASMLSLYIQRLSCCIVEICLLNHYLRAYEA